MSRPRINLIGAGKLGRTLARLWRDQLDIGAVITRSAPSARGAAAFIGAGEPMALDLTTLPPPTSEEATLPAADFWLLATPDDALGALAATLAEARDDWSGTVVFHCSGAASSELLAPLAQAGASVASAHPVHSFADPQHSLVTFAGTWCVLEGMSAATEALAALFAAAGARPFVAARCNKALYHASTAMASNLLVALLHQAEQALCDATGLSPVEARDMLAPLARHTLENYCRDGAVAALTGPVARGDGQTVARHLEVLTRRAEEDPHRDDTAREAAATYRSLSRTAVDIARQQAHTAEDILQRIRERLHEPR